jgi:hypothetical protein
MDPSCSYLSVCKENTAMSCLAKWKGKKVRLCHEHTHIRKQKKIASVIGIFGTLRQIAGVQIRATCSVLRG